MGWGLARLGATLSQLFLILQVSDSLKITFLLPELRKFNARMLHHSL